jgi:hypothetical protein
MTTSACKPTHDDLQKNRDGPRADWLEKRCKLSSEAAGKNRKNPDARKICLAVGESRKVSEARAKELADNAPILSPFELAWSPAACDA